MYIRLKTDHSLLESTLKVQTALQLALAAQHSFFAVCETGHFGSIAQAYTAATAAGIPFVAAIELTVEINDQSLPFILICKNEQGYQELLAYHPYLMNTQPVSFLKMLNFTNVICIPVLTLATLEMLGGLQKEIQLMYVGLSFSERIQPFEAEQIKQAEKKYNILCCMMNSIVMKDEKEAKTLAVLDAIKNNSRDLQKRVSVTNAFLPVERVAVLVEEYPELMTRIDALVQVASFALDVTKKMPRYPFLGEETSDHFLQNLVMKGAFRRYQVMTDEVRERIAKELEIIASLGFSDYFLILWDAKRYAFQNDILFGPGRGSSVGSIVAYCLGITEVDPLRYGLVFERFLNPGRKGYPDIDIDVADDKRDALIRYVKQRYGEDKVAHILTYGTFGAKSAFREVARIHGLSQTKIGEVTRHISHSAPLALSYKENERLQTLLKRDSELLNCYRIALQIEGLKRNTSTHAAGIIITDTPLLALVPVFAENGYTSGWEMKELEGNGFLKIDFLGLKNLSILDKLEQMIIEEDAAFQMQMIPLDDQKTYQYLSYGLTNGIFQLESSGIKKVLRDLKPSQFEDIVAVLALYRPGPMESIPLFIERKYGKAKIEMPHSDLAPILSETYGVIVYQEQIMQIVNVMANFDFVQADDFRRAISKKNELLLKTSLDSFERASLKNGYDHVTVKKVSDLMLQFANYGFVKGHAVAYALIAYRLMYFKTHYPLAFYTVLLNHHIQDISKVITYVHELKRRSITFLPPDIMLSAETFKAEKSGIRMGFCSIKGIGKQTAQQIIAIVMSSVEHTAEGLIRALMQHRISKEHIEALIVVGAFNRFQTTMQTLVMYVRSQSQDQGNYAHLSNLVAIDQEITHLPEYTIQEREKFEYTYLGYSFFQNMFAVFEPEYASGVLLPLQVLKTQRSHVHQTVARFISIRKHKNGKTQFVQIEDNTSDLSAVLFDMHILHNIQLENGKIYHFNIKCSLFNGRESYQIIKIAPIISK